MELLERADALGVLDELLAASASGGRIALVAGEAGAGKSALVGVFTGRAERHGRVLWGACDPLLTPRALGPLHDIARQTGGVLAERLAALDSDEHRRNAVFDALLDALDGPRQRPRPVVVLEDLHWADEATIDLVAFLGLPGLAAAGARRLGARPGRRGAGVGRAGPARREPGAGAGGAGAAPVPARRAGGAVGPGPGGAAGVRDG
jgi:predicted ATPase